MRKADIVEELQVHGIEVETTRDSRVITTKRGDYKVTIQVDEDHSIAFASAYVCYGGTWGDDRVKWTPQLTPTSVREFTEWGLGITQERRSERFRRRMGARRQARQEDGSVA